MGTKVIDWILANMPGFTAWVGGMSELGIVVLAFAFLAVVVITYNAIRFWLSGAFSDYPRENGGVKIGKENLTEA